MNVASNTEAPATSHAASTSTSQPPFANLPLAEQVSLALEDYFRHLNGHSPSDLYSLVMGEVERPLLAAVIAHTEGNLTRAAEYLGMNRATLRNKLKKYGLAS